VAYRQLFAMTLAAGLGLTACGGETDIGKVSNAPGASQPPGNADQPKNDTDRPPTSTDRPPTSTDQPPPSSEDSAGTGDGGRLGPLCTQFCAAVDQVVAECGMNDGDIAMDSLCSDEIDCSQIPSTPCDTEVAQLLSCFIQTLGGLCQAVNSEQQGPSADDLCRSETDAMAACSTANGLEDDEGQGGMNPPQNCTPTGGCACADECTRCTCQAGSDTTKLVACGTAGGACAP
jgi:hypothetical protein